MKRMPGESVADYRIRRKGEYLVERAHLKGRVNGRYVDPALHRTMDTMARREKWKDRAWGIGYMLLLSSVFFGVIALAAYFSNKVG